MANFHNYLEWLLESVSIPLFIIFSFPLLYRFVRDFFTEPEPEEIQVQVKPKSSTTTILFIVIAVLAGVATGLVGITQIFTASRPQEEKVEVLEDRIQELRNKLRELEEAGRKSDNQSYVPKLNVISPAFAEEEKSAGTPGSGLLPYIVGGIFLTMLVAFLTALGVTFLVDDTPKNQKKIDSADNIVKTFGGFFIGIITSFVNQVIGI